MFKSAVCIISGLGLILSSFFSGLFSNYRKWWGDSFRGAVVADPCEVTPRHQQFAISCPENNRMKTHTISYDEALRGHHPHSALAAVSMKYLNEQKTLAVVQVDYR